MARCSAKTKSGARCRRKATAGGERCHAHSGADDVGAPDGLTADAERRIVQAVRAGATREVAAAAAGVSRRTLQRWLARGAADNAPDRFRRLADAVEQAGAQREVQAHAHIARAGADDWRAEAWYLRYVRGYPDRHEHTGAAGGPIEVQTSSGWDLDQLTEAELDQLAELRRKATDG